MGGEGNNSGPGHPSSDSSDRGGRIGRPLPPPAFPPGSRRIPVRRPAEPAGGDLDRAFISPDDPIPDRTGVPNDAFIDPDEPITRVARLAADDAYISPDEPMPVRRLAPSGVAGEVEDQEEGVVTGLGDDAHLDPGELMSGLDPHVMELVEQVSKLADALRRKGEAGLRASPGMSRFETTLRAYCVGFLNGRRAEEEDG